MNKVKMIVSGLDTKVNLRVSLYASMQNYIRTKQENHKSNNAYITKLKLMVETLKIAGGDHIFVSEELLGTEIENTTVT